MDDTVRDVLDSPKFQDARAALRDDHARFVEEIVSLTEIPAPPFQEETRARAFAAMLDAQGLEDVGLDAIGNVTGLRRGRGNGSLVVIAAHLDTVFPEGTDVRVRREGTILHAPGVGDDTRGLASLLAFARALDAAGIETDHDLLFVGDVGEEGKGDLRGIRHLFTDAPHTGRIAAFYTIDGCDMDSMATAAVGSKRYRVAFRGPGGHSLMAFGTVNPAHAMAAVVTGLSELDVPETPRTTFCASVFGGGTSINAIPEEVWMEVDLRSEDAGELERLDTALHDLIDRAVERETGRGTGEVTAEIRRIGDRPAGATPEDAPIVTSALAALRAHGFDPKTGASSTDANIPMSLGVPAIQIANGPAGGRAHSLEEWIDVEPEATLRSQSAALAAILAVAGFRAE